MYEGFCAVNWHLTVSAIAVCFVLCAQMALASQSAPMQHSEQFMYQSHHF